MRRAVRSTLLITKPPGHDPRVVRREVVLSFDDSLNTVGVEFIGDTQLKGYMFEFVESEISRAKTLGTPWEGPVV